MANLALELEVDLERHESPGLVWYRAHASTVRGLLSLVVVGLVWEIAGRTGRWPLILAPISDIWIKFLQLAGTGELQRHILVSLNEFFVGFALAAVLGILLGIIRDPVGRIALIVFVTAVGEVILGTTAVLALFQTIGAIGMARGLFEHTQAVAATTVVLIFATAIMSIWLFIGAWLVQAVLP